jgi:hypothetical protein
VPLPLPVEAEQVAGLAEDCAAAAREVDARDPRTVARLTLAVEALDVALEPVRGWAETSSDLPALRDEVGDHLVALSAAGLAPVEREAVARSLVGVLTRAAVLLRGHRPAPGIC